MTAVDLPAIRALLAGATPGPWETMKSGMLGTRVVHVDGEWESLIPHEFVTMVTPALHKPTDAAFIAAAPSIVAQLLAVVDRVEGLGVRLQGNQAGDPDSAFDKGYAAGRRAAGDLLRAAINRVAYPKATERGPDV